MKRDAHADQFSGLSWPEAETRPEPLELAVCGELLIERRDFEGHLGYALFGRLDLNSTRWICSELLAGAPGIVLLDLAALAMADPAALLALIDRQRDDHREGRQLLLRLDSRQLSWLG